MEIFSNPAVIWFLIGLGLLLLELVLPGFVVMFFGIGAWIVALLLAFFDIGTEFQILIFLVTSIIGLIALRKVLKKKFFDKKDEKIEDQLEEFIGKTAEVLDDFTKGTGKVEFKGTHWKAVSESDLKKGDRVTIIEKDSLTLIVKPK